MQILENKALVLRTRTPEKYRIIPKSRVINTHSNGVHEVAVHWGLDEVRVLKNLGVKNVTSTITPNADKVQVFAGVRKLSSSNGMIAELSTNCNLTNGTFYLVPGNTATGGGPYYCFGSRGTNFVPVDSPANYTAPITDILTGIGDISAPISAIRVNGSQVAQSTASQGTGNYLAYPLYIGARAGTSLFFNGNLYGLIVRFGTNLDAATIPKIERFTNNKTGAY